MAASKKKNTNSRSGSNSKARGKQTPAQQEQRSMGIELAGLALICVGVVSFIVLLTTDNPNNAVRALLDGLAGRISIVLPFIILWIGLLTTFSGSRQYNIGRILKIACCILLGFSMVHIFFADGILAGLQLGGGWLNFMEQSFFMRTGAGAIGALLSYPVYIAAGRWGGFVILLFVLLALILLLKQISLRQVGEKAQVYFQNSYAGFRENQSVRSAERAERRRLAEEERYAREQAAQEWNSWDEATYDSESVEQIEPVSAGRRSSGKGKTGRNEPLPRHGNVLEVPDYLKDGNRRGRKPVFGGKSAENDTQTEVSSPFRTHGSKLVAQVAEPEEQAEYIQPEAGEYEQPAEDTPYYEDAADVPSYVDSSESYEEEPLFDETAEDLSVYTESEEPALDLPEEEWPIGDDPYAQPADLRVPNEEPDGAIDEDESASQPANLFEMPPFDIDEPVQRERRRKVLGEPVKPAPSPAPTYAPDDYVPNEDYDPNPSYKPGMRLDRTPLVITKHQDAIPEEGAPEYNYPPVDLLSLPKAAKEADRETKDREKAAKLESTLHDFGINAKLTGIAHGPAVTRFELAPAPGVKVSRITSLADDIALSLAALSVRIEAPIPGKAAVGVEIPNETVETVPLREVLESQEARKHPSRLAVGMGKDNSGRHIVGDIAKMPHVLIAGATGSGKSVCINCIICSILYRATPEEVRLIMIDPKVVELSIYNGIPHLLVPVVTDPKKASGALQWAVAEMTDRYNKFAQRGVRDMKGYNMSLGPDEKPMPQIVIIIDELADLMMVTPGEVEDSICRLAQLARAAGIHLVIATQRPSVNVITGVIKANIPARIAFTVASFVDSRTILDVGGAEKLLGRGDMLFAPAGSNKMQRVQGAWVSDEEVHAIVEYIKERHDVEYNEDVIEHMNKAEDAAEPDGEGEGPGSDCDELLQQAIEIAVEAGQASISMLQRRLRIGYARAGRLIDEMAARGIVSQSEGAKPRNVLITREQYNAMYRDPT